jgi:hypothetical protein
MVMVTVYVGGDGVDVGVCDGVGDSLMAEFNIRCLGCMCLVSNKPLMQSPRFSTKLEQQRQHGSLETPECKNKA